jgi:hypothetical protein
MLSLAVVPPVTPTPVEEIAEALDHIGPLHGLPLEDRLFTRKAPQPTIWSLSSKARFMYAASTEGRWRYSSVAPGK